MSQYWQENNKNINRGGKHLPYSKISTNKSSEEITELGKHHLVNTMIGFFFTLKINQLALKLWLGKNIYKISKYVSTRYLSSTKGKKTETLQ